jgi:hypothetical protein
VFFARSGAEARSVSSAQKRERARESEREENLIRGFGDGFDCPRKQQRQVEMRTSWLWNKNQRYDFLWFPLIRV